MRFGPLFAHLIVSSPGEKGIDQENGPVDDGNARLGQSHVLGVLVPGILPMLDGESAAGNEKTAADQAEENVDPFVDRC